MAHILISLDQNGWSLVDVRSKVILFGWVLFRAGLSLDSDIGLLHLS